MDKFTHAIDRVDFPARECFTITPHDTNEINPIPKAIRFNAAGTIAFRAVDSATDVAMTVAAGEVLHVRVQYMRSTGTTVATMHGLA